MGLLPVFVSLTSQQTPQERLRTNTTANFAVMVILWVSMFFGQIILDAFDISIASFRIAGGSLIVLIAWSMLQGKLGEVRHNKEEKGDTLAKESIAVVPLALPLMAGPGAISSTIVYSSQFNSAQQLLGMSLVVVVFLLLILADIPCGTFAVSPDGTYRYQRGDPYHGVDHDVAGY